MKKIIFLFSLTIIMGCQYPSSQRPDSKSKLAVTALTSAQVAGNTPAAETGTVATPTFSPAAGNQTSNSNITIATTTESATIHYTTDGTDPTTSSTTYSTALQNVWLLAGKTIKALAVRSGWTNSAIASAVYSILPLKTGQTTVYTTGDNGTNQTGIDKSYTDNGNGTITDNATGLVWQKCFIGRNNDATCSDDAFNMDFAAYTSANNYCNNLSLASRTWRLPTKIELETLVNRGAGAAPVINTTFFPATLPNRYWSSTENAANTANAWTLSFNVGDNVEIDKTDTNGSVRCVSGTAKELSTIFTDNGNETVTDNKTGLIWIKNSAVRGTEAFTAAITYCDGLTLGGRSDWRLPNINELLSIHDSTKTAGPVVNSALTMRANKYWSSTTNAQTTANAWMVWFGTGQDTLQEPKTNIGYTTCVTGP